MGLRDKLVDRLFGKTPATTAERVDAIRRATHAAHQAAQPKLRHAADLAQMYADEDKAMRR